MWDCGQLITHSIEDVLDDTTQVWFYRAALATKVTVKRKLIFNNKRSNCSGCILMVVDEQDEYLESPFEEVLFPV